MDFLPLTIGAILLLLAVGTAFESVRLVWRGLVSSGSVIGHTLDEGCYREVVEFTDRDGAQRQFTSRSGRGTRRHLKSSRVTVVYDPTHRDRAEIRSFGSLWLFPLCLSAFAALFLAFGFGILGHHQ